MNDQTSPDIAQEGRRYRGASNEQRKTERRLKLIEAGIKRFGTIGFHAATVKTICAEAGLTERYFYESFTNAEELFAACYTSIVDTLRGRIFIALEGVDSVDLEPMIRVGLHEVFSLVKENPPAARILLIEVLTVSREMEKLSMKVLYNFVELLKVIAGQAIGVQAAESSGVDLVLMSSGLVGATIHIAGRWAMDGYQQPLDQVVDNCARMYLAMASSLQ